MSNLIWLKESKESETNTHEILIENEKRAAKYSAGRIHKKAKTLSRLGNCQKKEKVQNLFFCFISFHGKKSDYLGQRQGYS